jgi:tetratricopeptide (TPR) repeat protein
MSHNKDDMFVAVSDKAPADSGPFVSDAQSQVNSEDLFAGDMSFMKDLLPPKTAGAAAEKTISSAGFRPLYLIVAANILITAILGMVFWFAPPRVFLSAQPATSSLPSDSNSTAAAQPVAAVNPVVQNNQTTAPQVADSNAVAESQDESQPQAAQSVSLKMAEALVTQGELVKASDVFRQIASNTAVGGAGSEEFRDYLRLRIAACLHQANLVDAQAAYFAEALTSRSGLVRGLGSYYLATVYFKHGEYLQARKYAYQTLGLLKTFSEVVPATLEADMYFLAAESLSRYALSLHPIDQELPGRLWSDSMEMIWPSDLDQTVLCEVINSSAQRLSEGAGGPRLQVDAHQPAGSQWSQVCLQSPVEETIVKLVSLTGMGLVWQTPDTVVRSRPVTAYLPKSAEQYIAEVIAGSAGLVWKYDGQNATIFIPDNYDDFGQHRSAIISESVAIWRRFLLRYRGEHRTANAHYALGRMYNLDHQYATSLAEFKVIQSHFEHNPLAPFAYLEASLIRTQMKDYFGAKADLNEMLMLYPDCTAADHATLCLAEASLESNQIEEARNLFTKVYQLNLNKNGRVQALYGLGRCTFLQKDWEAAKKWLGEMLDNLEDKSDKRLADACLMLGRVLIELGENQQASVVLRIPLGGTLSDTEYVKIIQELVQAEMDQENYLEALNILESVPQARLSQKDSCEVLIWQSIVLRAIDAAPTAASLIRRKIEYIADSQLRAWLTLELAQSYYSMGDYSLARRELNDILADMQDPIRVRQSELLLAKIAEKLEQPRQAEKICKMILAGNDLDLPVRQEVYEILGRIYTGQKMYDKAALAFAGIASQEGDLP